MRRGPARSMDGDSESVVDHEYNGYTVIDRDEVIHTNQSRLSRDDKRNILVLVFLYILQGIPLGLAASIPMIIQNHNVNYKDQAMFSFVTWPFSIKLLWAPFVDSLYIRAIGRRKTWLIPTQYLIGVFMIVLASYAPSLLGDADHSPNIKVLTLVFFGMNFLAATQDIVVDGWALTMLSRENVGYAPICNSIGQTAGYFLGYIVLLALESADFCNKYLRSVPHTEGIVTLSSFLQFWGIVFFISTTVVLIFKSEHENTTEEFLGVKETFLQLFRIFGLGSIWMMIFFLMTCKIPFSATDAVTPLKLVEAGVPRSNLALLAIPIIPVQLLLPVWISKYTSGPRPLHVFLRAYPYRLGFGVIIGILVYWTHHVQSPGGDFPVYYYATVVAIYIFHQVSAYSIFVALMSFYAQISDPSIGGTYMTLLNTITNLGGNFSASLALWLIDDLTVKTCENSLFSCDTAELALKCTDAGHKCLIQRDGYYVEVILCTIFGVLWLKWGQSMVRKIQQLPMSAWRCSR